MKTLVLILVVALLNILTIARADEELIPFINVPQLSVVESKGEKVEGNTASFDFGEWPMWDSSLTAAAWNAVDPRLIWQGSPKVKIFHRFTLQNKTKETITATSFKVEDNIEEIRSVDMLSFPYKIAPDKKVTLDIYFGYQNSFPGPMTGSVQLMGMGTKKPLAIMNLSSRVTTGIVVQPATLNFGEVPVGQEMTREFTVTFDHHMPTIMAAMPVKFFCKNPALKIQWNPTKQDLMGVKIEKDVIIFPQGDKEFPQDLTLKFTATLSKDASVGALDEHIRLIAVGMPMASVVRGVQTRVQGRVVPKSVVLPK